MTAEDKSLDVPNLFILKKQNVRKFCYIKNCELLGDILMKCGLCERTIFGLYTEAFVSTLLVQQCVKLDVILC
jgi:hypothetical protein